MILYQLIEAKTIQANVSLFMNVADIISEFKINLKWALKSEQSNNCHNK